MKEGSGVGGGGGGRWKSGGGICLSTPAEKIITPKSNKLVWCIASILLLSRSE